MNIDTLKLKTPAAALLAVGLVVGAGLGLYQLGVQRGLDRSPAQGDPAGAERAPVDPSSWGIPEGEAATRRHMEAGLKAGDVDPLTGRTILHYQDPMMPGKKFAVPGKSPYMDMLLVPVYRDGGAVGEADPGGVISARLQQDLGLRTAAVVGGAIAPRVSAAGGIAW